MFLSRFLPLAVLVVGYGLIAAFSFKPTHFLRDRTSLFSSSQNKDALIAAFEGSTSSNIYACPQSLSNLQRKRKIIGFVDEDYYYEPEFGSKYPKRNFYFDFTIPSEVDKPFWSLSTSERVGQSFFQNPIISGVYERGYRQNFVNYGFPGIDKEFEEVDAFFLEANASVVLDLSCGSGFMSRKLLKSGRYLKVISGDLSPNMLEETKSRCVAEGLSLKSTSTVHEMVRCDSARLPFRSESLDAVHAGAALHCWPRLSEALADVYRVLKPGGSFFASTIFSTPFSGEQRINTGFYFFKDENELQDLFEKAGFVGSGGSCTVRREGRACAIIKARKFTRIDA